VSGVQIWLAHLDSLSAAQLETLGALLDPAERVRAARFHFESDRNHYIACRGLLRRLISAALDTPASTLVIEYGVHGKPAIAPDANPRALRFNLSHSNGWALFALAWDREVGIDLESGVRLESDENDLSPLAERILSERELAIWHSLPDSATRRAAFLRAWTRKEAFAKATGKGVFDQWNRFELVLDATSPSPSVIVRLPPHGEEPASAWLIHDLSAPDGFAAALALEQKNPLP
jgi:4'-phosphopantetheinyl transferase